MLKIDDNLLQTIGLGALPTEDKRGLLTHIYETLEMRVGMRLADQMTNEQLDEFETYFEAKDDAGAFKWLESNFPNYKDIVNEEFEKLKGEVQQSAPQILAAAQANAAAQPPQPQVAAPADPAVYAQPQSMPAQAQQPQPQQPAAAPWPTAAQPAAPAQQPPQYQPAAPAAQPWQPEPVAPDPMTPLPLTPQAAPVAQPPQPQQFQPMPPAWTPDQPQQGN